MDGGILTFVHLADTHVGTDWDRKAPNFLCSNRFQTAITEINNVIKPAAVILCGDVTTWSDNYSIHTYLKIIANTNIPIFPIPGNHDQADSENYLYHIGPYRTWFDVGPHRVIGFTTNKLDKTWMENLLATTDKSGILFSHYVLRLPAGSTADPWFFLMSQGERAVGQSLMSQ